MEFYSVSFLWHITVATLFLMTLYSLIIGIKSNLKAFYAYCIYSGFLLCYMLINSPYIDFTKNLSSLELTSFVTLRWFLQVIYNSVYVYFFIYLLEVKSYLPKFKKYLQISVNTIFLVSLGFALIALVLNNTYIFENYFKFGFTPIMTIIAITSLIKLWQIPEKLKIFFFLGSLFYLVLAIVALVLSILEINVEPNADGIAPIIYFYSGIIIEQLFFGFALAYFIELINRKYHLVLKNNLKLKESHNLELSRKLKQQSIKLQEMAEEAKAKKIAYIKSQYDAKLNESKLSSLQSKMNPHFIFNALNSIKAYLIENDKRKAINYMNRFSKLIRKILEGSRIETTSLQEELDMIQLYVDIENTRFNNEIDFAICNHTQKEVLSLGLPPLILQPFVENALWHGLSAKDGEKRLRIRILCENNVPYVEIEDNGIGLENSQKHSKASTIRRKSVGLKLNRERLWVYNQRFNTAYEFEIKEKKGEASGTFVRMYLKPRP